jgi:hypothetical protein
VAGGRVEAGLGPKFAKFALTTRGRAHARMCARAPMITTKRKSEAFAGTIARL